MMKKYLIIFSSFLVLYSVVISQKVAAEVTSTGNSQQVTKGNTNSNSVIIIVGASYAKGWKPETIAGLKTINKGIGGSETGEMLTRYQVDVLDAKPRAVIIWGFLNDIFRSQPETIDARIATLKENIVKMVELARNNGIKPIIATEVTITSPDSWKEKIMNIIGTIRGKQSYHEYINQHVIAINEWLRKYAKDQQLPLLDFEKILADDDGARKREFALEDGSHLTKAAYDALSTYVEAIDLAM